jgi:hypothetical protein
MSRVAALALLLLLAACGPQTGTPVPTAPPGQSTPVPLIDRALEFLLLSAGDLPADLSGEQGHDVAPTMFPGKPDAV